MEAPRPTRSRRAVAGVVSAGFGMGIAELTAGILPEGRSPLVAAGEFVIRNTPGGAERWAIRTFGTNDKPFLVISAVVTILILGALAGALATKPAAAMVVAVPVVAFGVLTSMRHQDSTILDAIPAVVGGIAALIVLRSLLRLDSGQPSGPLSPDAMGRRTVLFAGGAAAVAAPIAGLVGHKLQQRVDAAASRARVSLPTAARPLAAAPAGAELHLEGQSPLFTPNEDFYRIDTALLIPQVDADTWSMRIFGMVDHVLTLNYDQLLARPLVEADITLACVSNEVGGSLVGNARWLGVPLKELLEEAGVKAGADQVVGRSVDGFTVGFPTATALDGRDALVAVGMNGEPLPVRHGFPVRLVVPGLYGYVSATKWLSEIELSRFADFDPYWIRLGWSGPAPIKISSRIDTPRGRVAGGDVNVAGVAWAQHRGIGAVEVRIDEGAWQPAELAESIGDDSWRQWVYRWKATGGRHNLEVRATGADGEVQTGAPEAPFPSGSTGYHSRSITVS